MKVFRRTASTLSMQTGSQVNGVHGDYIISKQLLHNIWQAVNEQRKHNVIVKTAPRAPFCKECDVLKRFQTVPYLRHLVDEVQDPPLLVLEYLDSNLLSESATRKLQSSEVKHVTKAVLQALAALHEEGIVDTDVKPDNILVNYSDNGSRFKDIKLADCGDSTHLDSVVEEHIIGAPIFRSPEALLKLIWGPSTDICSLGATASFPLLAPNDTGRIGIFSVPAISNPTDSAYTMGVLRRQSKYFGPFPLSYLNIADDDNRIDHLDLLAVVTRSVDMYTPFKMASSREITKEDREFICKLMQLDPRDRPSARELLQDVWLTERTGDFK